MSSGIRIGLIGCGRWGRNILRDLCSTGAEIYVAERNEKNRSLALSMGAQQAVPELANLPAELDGYVVAVQTVFHESILKILAETNKPMFVEKPMVPDLEQAQKVAGLMGDRLFVMHKWRYHPGIEMLAEVVQAGNYGPVRRIFTTRMQWMQPHSDVDACWILAPHDLSIIYHILGRIPEPLTMQADISGDCIRGFTALLGPSPMITMNISEMYPRVERAVVIHMEGAVLSMLDPLSDHLLLNLLDKNGAPTEKSEKIKISTEFPLLRELKAFISYLEGGPRPFSSVEDELEIIATLQKLRVLALNS